MRTGREHGGNDPCILCAALGQSERSLPEQEFPGVKGPPMSRREATDSILLENRYVSCDPNPLIVLWPRLRLGVSGVADQNPYVLHLLVKAVYLRTPTRPLCARPHAQRLAVASGCIASCCDARWQVGQGLKLGKRTLRSRKRALVFRA
jgi:hypothetical protein